MTGSARLAALMVDIYGSSTSVAASFLMWTAITQEGEEAKWPQDSIETISFEDAVAGERKPVIDFIGVYCAVKRTMPPLWTHSSPRSSKYWQHTAIFFSKFWTSETSNSFSTLSLTISTHFWDRSSLLFGILFGRNSWFQIFRGGCPLLNNQSVIRFNFCRRRRHNYSYCKT